MKSKITRILSIIMFVPCNNLPGYTSHVIYLIVSAFVEDITIIDCLESMKPYVSDILESY